MSSEFEMSMMGELNFFLGLQIKQTSKGTQISQQKYLKELLKKYGASEGKTMMTPMGTNERLDADEQGISVDQKKYRGMIESLLHLTASRPDIVFSVGLCARFQANPKESHLKVVKRIFKYLKGTTNLCLWKSTSGTAHFLGPCLVSWSSKKQNSVALSTAEAEYVAAASCCSQSLWIMQQVSDYGINLNYTPILCDNTSAISISKDSVMHSRTKHIHIRHHFLRDCVEKGLIRVEYCSTEKQIADIFTKALGRERFELIRLELGLINA
ncbi:unnamed protein product [Cuscuta europaea]|uniref:Reverse transcriptase Ty1/copia-type domain-containing protein n=1 Tax=Cuscuta europaea TaxID=41803 RepID=A0A9P0ZSN8_CUSEU|nr:unnamed protein product [Cuscuta europaea]